MARTKQTAPKSTGGTRGRRQLEPKSKSRGANPLPATARRALGTLQCSYYAGDASGSSGGSSAATVTVNTNSARLPGLEKLSWDEVEDKFDGTYSEEISLAHLPPDVIAAFAKIPDSHPGDLDSFDQKQFSIYKDPNRFVFEAEASCDIQEGTYLTPSGGGMYTKDAYLALVGGELEDMQHLWSIDVEPNLINLKRAGLYDGRTDLVLVLQESGSIVRVLSDPYWLGGPASDYNVAVGPAEWKGGKPMYLLHATRAIAKGM